MSGAPAVSLMAGTRGWGRGNKGGGPGTGRPIYAKVRSIGPQPQPVYPPRALAGSLAWAGDYDAAAMTTQGTKNIHRRQAWPRAQIRCMPCPLPTDKTTQARYQQLVATIRLPT